MTKTIKTNAYGKLTINRTDETATYWWFDRTYTRRVWVDEKGRTWVKQDNQFNEVKKDDLMNYRMSFDGAFGNELAA